MDEIYALADQQGWSDATLLSLSLDFIREAANLDALFTHLRAAADAENSATE